MYTVWLTSNCGDIFSYYTLLLHSAFSPPLSIVSVDRMDLMQWRSYLYSQYGHGRTTFWPEIVCAYSYQFTASFRPESVLLWEL